MLTDHGPFRSDDERNKDSLEREEEKSREVKFGKEPEQSSTLKKLGTFKSMRSMGSMRLERKQTEKRQWSVQAPRVNVIKDPMFSDMLDDGTNEEEKKKEESASPNKQKEEVEV